MELCVCVYTHAYAHTPHKEKTKPQSPGTMAHIRNPHTLTANTGGP